MKKLHTFTLTLALVAMSSMAIAAPAPTATKNPKVAQVGDKVLYLSDVMARKGAFRELQSVPVESVYEGLLQQMVAELLIEEQVKKGTLANDPEVLERTRKAKDAAMMQVYIERQIEKMVTDEELMTLFKDLMKDYKKQKEVQAQHILVQNEADAQAIIKELEAGKDFGEIARVKSIDPTTKERGGDLGFFVKDIATETMGPDFAESVFILRPGNYTRKPVKTRFGYHVVRVNDSRMSKPPKFEEAAPQLRVLKSQEALLKFVDGLKKQKGVKLFGMDGNPLKEKKADKVTVK